MTVKSVMTHNPFTVGPQSPITDAQALMKREKIHRLPVLDTAKRLIGIVSEKDLLYASPSPATTLNVYEMHSLLAKLKVESVMTRKLITVTSDTLVEDAARALVDNNIGGLPVVDSGTLVGIVTESDLFRLLIDLFGTRTKGVRATLRVPERPGELADTTRVIAEAGGNVISIGTFSGNDVTNSVMILKVENIERDRLIAILEPLVVEVMDVREV
ncbi:MAG: CBS domain-containing protein [Spirochaetaceae bacterium]|nr:MAG: CBS domain-containing protein [Spirochaetaceae bacterium]